MTVLGPLITGEKKKTQRSCDSLKRRGHRESEVVQTEVFQGGCGETKIKLAADYADNADWNDADKT